jgi:ubiquinone biosynthesis protein UbiJ
MRTMLDAGRAAGLDVRIGFVLGHETFLARLANGAIDVARGPVAGADLVLSAAPPVIAAALYGDQSLAALEAAGALSLQGDRALAERFATLFPMPAKVERAL